MMGLAVWHHLAYLPWCVGQAMLAVRANQLSLIAVRYSESIIIVG
jgi:hypothetical protein